MSPEKVALLLFTASWALPAGTSGASPPGICVGAGNPTLNLASSSVDDLYKGCKYAMRQHLPSLIKKELTKNKNFCLAWNKAKKEWMRKTNMYIFPNTMKAFCSVAVVAYTLNNPPLYKDFNTATRTGWTGPNAYARYPFKALHFLLTQAPKEIWGIKPSCATVYRGTNVNFSISRLFRFGQFTSTSKSSKKATNFGQKTFFILVSCMGYRLRDLSHFPDEQEVLVPPSEMFRVTRIQRTWMRETVHAKSVGVCSNHNCAYTRKGDPNVKKCPPHQVLHL
ncbi:NAD(P)(+)--arginine ADP-ribosyltransferase 2-like [Gopherus evgoodei]|uniref:NAD(P)(+)--arginine ADP-ribosyltransferase n=1 Tax=Gopherus evgoodei TaxID=1825980 RepID=A0A8C4WJT7_9SAUR|nr:NAD(P)(+)--arginine ADP-ribosyltransferase 2-like [Gopherus evgoodei]